MEEWRVLDEYPDYAVSNLGHVVNIHTDRIMRSRISSNGYERVGLMKNGKQVGVFVHRLVAQAFISLIIDSDQVNHLDGDKLNNQVDNLEWVTMSENHLHAFRTGLKTAPNKRRVRVIETGDVYESIRACARAVGGIPQGVHNCLSGRFHTYLGFTYEYVG
jgi:hypothetical protein